MLPQENFRKFDALRWFLSSYLGLKTSLGSLCFSLGMVTKFTSRPMHGDWCLTVSGTPKKAAQESLIPSNTHQECVSTVLTIYLFSGLHSSLLRSDCEVCAGTNLCWRYACVFPTSKESATSSQKTLVRQLPGLPDLLCQPCQREMDA